MRMTDFTFIQAVQCKQLSKVVADVDGYYVSGLGSERSYPQCNCPAYRFGKRTENFGGRFYPKFCKHIEKYYKESCDWHNQFSSEEQVEDGVCPKCGGPTEYVQFAV